MENYDLLLYIDTCLRDIDTSSLSSHSFFSSSAVRNAVWLIRRTDAGANGFLPPVICWARWLWCELHRLELVDADHSQVVKIPHQLKVGPASCECLALLIVRCVHMVQQEIPRPLVRSAAEPFRRAKRAPCGIGRFMRSKMAQDVCSPFFGIIKGIVAVKYMEEADVYLLMVSKRGGRRGRRMGRSLETMDWRYDKGSRAIFFKDTTSDNSRWPQCIKVQARWRRVRGRTAGRQGGYGCCFVRPWRISRNDVLSWSAAKPRILVLPPSTRSR
jgi:hypothetical protein